MKYIRIFMMLMAVSLFAACSDDEKGTNTNECTLGFSEAATTVSETAGYVQIPISVTGRRNGPIHVTVETSPVGNNPAVEGTNYIVTDKTLNLNADTLSSGTIDVEVQIINDSEINEDRQFQVTLTSVEGATVTTQSTVITISDDDGSIYQQMFGTWLMTGYQLNFNTGTVDVAFSKTISLSGTTNQFDPNYERVLTAEAVDLLGYGETSSWRMNYSFDPSSGNGTLAFVCGETICSLQSSDGQEQPFMWAYQPAGSSGLSLSPMSTNWALEDGHAPTTITFSPRDILYGGYTDTATGYFTYANCFTNIVLTKQ